MSMQQPIAGQPPMTRMPMAPPNNQPLTSQSTFGGQQSDGGLGFILRTFVEDTQGVLFAQTVSADGIHLAASNGYDAPSHEVFAAIASGLASLTDSAVTNFGLGRVTRQIIEATNGWILVSRISDTAAMGVVASATADLGLVGYEMTLLTQRLGDVMSPDLIERLRNAVPSLR